MQVISHKEHMKQVLSMHTHKHYVYVLRWPDNIESHGAIGTPFYVGIGQRLRLFEHEKEANQSDRETEKLAVIRKIRQGGKEVVYTIDSWHDTDPYLREAELINIIGRIANGTGTLTNAQTYAHPVKIDGTEVSKYYERQRAAGRVDALPADFPYKDTCLKVGERKPLRENSVFGIIYKTLEDNPGITGQNLVEPLLQVDWSVCKTTRYTSSGKPCATWICDYVKGGFYAKNQHIQRSLP